MVATHASKEVVWLQRLCLSMALVQWVIRIDCDSQSENFLAKNYAYHSKRNHIDVQYHFVRDMVEDKKVLLVKLDTLKHVVDALTKSMSTKNSFWCRETMGSAGKDQWLASLVGPHRKKTRSGRMLGVCYTLSMTSPMRRGLIAFPVCCIGRNRGGGNPPSRGVVPPLYGIQGRTSGNLFLGTILCGQTYLCFCVWFLHMSWWFSIHGIL